MLQQGGLSLLLGVGLLLLQAVHKSGLIRSGKGLAARSLQRHLRYQEAAAAAAARGAAASAAASAAAAAAAGAAAGALLFVRFREASLSAIVIAAGWIPAGSRG